MNKITWNDIKEYIVLRDIENSCDDNIEQSSSGDISFILNFLDNAFKNIDEPNDNMYVCIQ